MSLKFPKMLRCNGIPIVRWPRRVGNTGEIKKVSREKNIFFEHETKTRKIVRYVLYIGYGRYAAQFLDRLEHSECTNLFGDFFFRDFFFNPPIFTMVIPIVNCRRCRRPGVDFDDFSRFFIYFRREKCFSNLSGPISTWNFTGNPFLMVSERYGNAKFVKSRKNPKKSRQTRFSGQPSLSIIPGCHCSY